jgi:phosphoglycerate-specific signal transduction histidine kinase
MTTSGPLPPRIQIVDADGFAALVADRKRLTDTLHQIDDLLATIFIVARDGDYQTAMLEWLHQNITIHDDPAVSETARKREEYRRGLEATIIAIKEAIGAGPDCPNEMLPTVIAKALKRMADALNRKEEGK